jgi:hypothetical protein
MGRAYATPLVGKTVVDRDLPQAWLSNAWF